jgi:hypothetical protein
MIEAAILAAFAAFWLTQLVKLVPWPLQAWTKQVLAGLFSAGGVFVLRTGEQHEDLLVAAIAAAGLAAIIHRTHRWLGGAGDAARISVITQSGRRPRM